jgi:hypothetical protein
MDNINNDYTLQNLHSNLLFNLGQYKKSIEVSKPKNTHKVNIFGENNCATFIGDDRYDTHLDSVIRRLNSGINFRGLDTDIIEKIVGTSTSLDSSVYYHGGYMHYLLAAWENKLGIQVAPWHLWNIFLWNLKLISMNNTKFNKLWNNDSTMTLSNITIQGGYNIDEMKNELLLRIPGDTCNALLLDFNNNVSQTEYYVDTILGLMGGSITHYSNKVSKTDEEIFTPSVTVLGSKEQWNLLIEQIKLVKILYLTSESSQVMKYLDNVSSYFQECYDNLESLEYWIGFFYLDESNNNLVGGNIEKLFAIGEISLDFIPKIVGTMEYKLPDTDTSNTSQSNTKTQRLISGVLSSKIIDNTLIPLFGYIITEIDLVNNTASASRITENNKLIEACTLLNSYTRSPVYHAEMDEKCFLNDFNTTEVILNNISFDEYIQRLKQYNKLINVDVEKEKIEILRLKYQDVDRATILSTLVINKMNNLKTKSNFWFKDNLNMPWNQCQRINLTTELWLRGRLQQTNEDVKLICDNLNDIMDNLYKVKLYGNKSMMIEKIILATYNENIYHSYITLCSEETEESDDECDFEEGTDNDNMRFDTEDNYITTTTIKTLSRVIHFLLMNILINGNPISTDYLNYSTHTDLICEMLICNLMAKYNIDTGIKVYNRLIRDKIKPIITKEGNNLDNLKEQINANSEPSQLYKELVQLYQFIYILRIPLKSEKLKEIKSLALMISNILNDCGYKTRIEGKNVLIEDTQECLESNTN